MTTATLVVLQIYLPLFGRFEITLWQSLLLLWLPATLVLGLPPGAAFRQPPAVGVLLLLTGSLALAPTSGGGEPAVRTAVFLAIALSAYLLGYRVGVDGRAATLLRAFVAAGLPFAVLNILFFLLPRAEVAFLQSPIAFVLVEPNTLRGLFEGGLGNNVLAPGKAGTLFVNTNVASIFFGFGTCTALYLFVRRRESWRCAATVLYLGAVLSTGSRAGLAAMAGAGVVVGLVSVRSVGAARVVRYAGVSLLVIIAALALPMSRAPLLRMASVANTGDPRLLIWLHAAQLLRQHPLKGVGFGGWADSFPTYARAVGLDPSLPPHNAYLIAWLWLGLAGLATMALIFGGTLASFWKLTARRWLLDLGLLGMALTSWFATQLFFTNFALLEPRVGGAFLLLIGSLYGAAERRRLHDAKAGRRVQEHLPEALRGMAVQPSRGTGAVRGADLLSATD